MHHRNTVVRKCLKGIATEALYGKPPLPEGQLKPVSDFFRIKTDEVTFAHLAIFRQALETTKGDVNAFNMLAAYAGEKPSDKVEVVTSDLSALDAAFEGEAVDGT